MPEKDPHAGGSEASSRPSVVVSPDPGIDPETLGHLLEGMEEEGIPFTVDGACGPGSATDLALGAASASRLEVGVGLAADGAALHHRELPPDRPILRLAAGCLSPAELRRMGSNAARLVKGNPFRLEEEPGREPAVKFRKSGPAGEGPSIEQPQDPVDILVRLVLEHMATAKVQDGKQS